MKKKFLFLLFFACGFILIILLKFIFFKKNSYQGRLQILSSPKADVYINNKILGSTPFDKTFPEGEYILELIPKKEGSSSANWKEKIRITGNTLTFVSREFGKEDQFSSGIILSLQKNEKASLLTQKGELEVQTEPKGAIVYLEGEEKGIAPLRLSNIEQGVHEFSVFIPGYFRKTKKIKIEPGYRILAFVKLSRNPSYKELPEEPAIEPASKEATTKLPIKRSVIVIDTPTGWLRVRQSPSINSSESAKIKPKTKWDVLEEENGWLKIEYEKGKFGWISSQYTKPEPQNPE